MLFQSLCLLLTLISTIKQAKILQWIKRREQVAQRLAICVQRVFRGHIGRRLAKVQSLQRDQKRSVDVLRNKCATTIARVWRGYCGRLDARYLQKEMAEFLIAIREEEARNEEREYLALHRWFG